MNAFMDNKPVKLYIMSNLILITSKTNNAEERYYSHLEMDNNCGAKDLPDDKYMKNIFSIRGTSGEFVFSAKDKKSKIETVDKINEVVGIIKNKIR